MRTTMIYLFVLILSLAVNYKEASELFCDVAPAKSQEDCPDKEISADDIKWTVDTSFNYRKAVYKTSENPMVELDFHRALYLEFKKDEDVVLYTKNNDECRRVWTRTTSMISNVEKSDVVLFPGPTVVLPGKIGHKILVAVFQPECRYYGTFKSDVFKRVDHVFMRRIITKPMDEKLKTMDTAKYSFGNYIFAQQGGDLNDNNVPHQTKEVNLFFPFNTNVFKTLKKQECKYKCKFGTIIEFQLSTGLDFANKFHLDKKCEWMSFQNNHETEENRIWSAEISLRHSFVTLPREVKAFPLDFMNTQEEGYEVTIAYYTTGKTSNLVISNGHGRAVRSTFLHGSTKSITFSFSQDNCLSQPIGAETENNKFKDIEYDKFLNLGYRVHTVGPSGDFPGFKAFRYTDNADQDPSKEIYKDIATWDTTFLSAEGASNQEKPEDKTDLENGPENTGVEETTRAPIDYSLVFVTRDPVTPFVLSQDDFEKTERDNKDAEALARAIAEALKTTRYLYWAIPTGFSAGSFSSFIICNIILFIFKRTVLTFWYKAMYKRYGSDTTMGAGTTMGKTVGGETIGGSTTVGGGTTVGGTTAGGETTGSTTAA